MQSPGVSAQRSKLEAVASLLSFGAAPQPKAVAATVDAQAFQAKVLEPGQLQKWKASQQDALSANRNDPAAQEQGLSKTDPNGPQNDAKPLDAGAAAAPDPLAKPAPEHQQALDANATAKPDPLAKPAPQPGKDTDSDVAMDDKLGAAPAPQPTGKVKSVAQVDDEQDARVAELKELIARENLTSQEIKYTRGLMDELQLRPDPQNPQELIAMNDKPIQMAPIEVGASLMATLSSPPQRPAPANAAQPKPHWK